MNRFFTLCLIFTFCNATLSAQVIYVKQDASGQNDGSNWADAFTDLRQALAIALPGQQVWVAQGVYSPFISWDTASYNSFNMPGGIRLYGGFAGTETSLQQRDWETNLTVIGSSNQNLIYCENTDSNTVIDGFTIRNGQADIPFWLQKEVFCWQDPNQSICYGGGIYLYSKTPEFPTFLTVRNCEVSYNAAKYGGGISANLYGGGGGLRLENCYFEGNQAGNEGIGAVVFLQTGQGPAFDMWIKGCEFYKNKSYFAVGAVSIVAGTFDKKITISNCYFHENNSNYGYGAVSLGGSGENMAVENCLFEKNTAALSLTGAGGALGGLAFRVDACQFFENKADRGGAISAGSVKITNCIFGNNSAVKQGGGINIGEKCYLVNNTFVNNHSGLTGGAIENRYPSVDTIINCLFWNNTTGTSGGGGMHFGYPDDIPNCYLDHNSFAESDIGAFIPGFDSGSTDSLMLGVNNLFGISNPMLRDTAGQDFRLSACSPLINRGSGIWTAYLGLILDLDGTERIKNGYPDIGANESEIFTFLYDKTDVICPGAATGAISLLHTGGTPPFDYQWNNGGNSQELSGLSGGTYVVTVHDASWCADTLSVLLEEPPLFYLSATITDVSTAGSSDGAISIDSISGGVPNYTGLWNTGSSALTLENAPAGDYSFHLTDANGCDTTFIFTVGVAIGTDNAPERQFQVQVTSNPGNMPVLQFEAASTQYATISIFGVAGSPEFSEEIQIVSGRSAFQVQANLNSGMYLIQVKSREGPIRSFKYVVL